MKIETDDETGKNEDSDTKRKSNNPKWGELTRWSKDNQPTGKAKSDGIKRAKRNRELAQLLLGMKFVGLVNVRDPKTGEVVGQEQSPFKQMLGAYFGLAPDAIDEMTIETAIQLRLIGEAIEKGDKQAAELMMHTAYGRPKEYIELTDEDGNRPEINITVVNALPGKDGIAPEIAENEGFAEDVKPIE